MMKNIIEIENVSFRYKGSAESLLDNFSLTVKKGEVLLLCGESGSGKTTVIRLINGLIPHYYQGELEGNVRVAERDIKETELYELAGTVGTVFQNPRSQFFSVDTDGEIVFGPENIGLATDEIIRRKQETVKELDIEKLLGKSLFELSGGEKQKIACASVSALLPDIILLDEPSANLDRTATEYLRETIIKWKKQGKTIIISEHRLWYLRDIVDRVIHMENGRIKNEWTGKDFSGLSSESIQKLRLRPLTVEDTFSSENDSSSFLDMPEENAVILENFFFTYKRRPHLFFRKKLTQADEDILTLNIPKLRLPKNSVIAVVGSNGTGKSTFLRCVCGLERDCPGVITMDGKEYKGKIRTELCYMVMQDVNHQLFTDSVMAEVMLSMKDKNEKACEIILESLGLLPYKDKHPMALSGGQKQRVAIASAVAAGAKLLLFDEPTSGLDLSHMEMVGQLLTDLARSGSTVLVSTHDPELIGQCCDYILCIDKGKVGYYKIKE